MHSRSPGQRCDWKERAVVFTETHLLPIYVRAHRGLCSGSQPAAAHPLSRHKHSSGRVLELSTFPDMGCSPEGKVVLSWAHGSAEKSQSPSQEQCLDPSMNIKISSSMVLSLSPVAQTWHSASPVSAGPSGFQNLVTDTLCFQSKTMLHSLITLLFCKMRGLKSMFSEDPVISNLLCIWVNSKWLLVASKIQIYALRMQIGHHKRPLRSCKNCLS